MLLVGLALCVGLTANSVKNGTLPAGNPQACRSAAQRAKLSAPDPQPHMLHYRALHPRLHHTTAHLNPLSSPLLSSIPQT